jgi:DNA topoisomerase VI subunit B
MTVQQRITFSTSRLADFTSEKGLASLTGCGPDDWPFVIIKELVDNGIDACEGAGVSPHLGVTIQGDTIVVEDNAPGIAADVVRRICDYRQQTSSHAAYVGPARGQQGNALQTVFALPYVAHGGHDAVGETIIESLGKRHRIVFCADPLSREPKIDYEETDSDVVIGTRVIVPWPRSLAGARDTLISYACRFLWLNPHLRLRLDGEDVPALKEGWSKWKPGATHAAWYGLDQFKRLIAARASHDPAATVRDFVRMFDNLSSKEKASQIIGTVDAERETLATFARLGEQRVECLLAAMQHTANLVAPERLGVLGRAHLASTARLWGVNDLTRFQYRKAAFVVGGLPYLAEASFVYAPNLPSRRVIAGLNHSPDFPGRSPFRELYKNQGGEAISLDDLLAGLEVDPRDPVIVFIHVVSPRFEFTDKGKTAVILPGEVGEGIADLIEAVTARWTKAKRKANATEARLDRAFRKQPKNMTLGEALRFVEAGRGHDVMTRAYFEASDDGHGGRAPIEPRQIYYKARPLLLALMGKDPGGKYFSQTLLPEYLRDHPDETADWDITSKGRGTLHEPHTGRRLRLGTIEVRNYLGGFAAPEAQPARIAAPTIVTRGPAGRYDGVLYIEKEGFMPQIERAGIAERFDIAVLSDEGMSTVAGRRLVDDVCGRLDKPLFTLHDFDVTGFDIQHRISNSNERYRFRHTIKTVIDFGLRLDDVERWGLQSEPVDIPVKGKPYEIAAKRANWLAATARRLIERGATRAEIAFLLTDDHGVRGDMMKRVELNALDARSFVAFIEDKLEEHGLGKVTPDAVALGAAYATFVRANRIRARLGPEIDRLNAEPVDVPGDLAERVRDELTADRDASWDKVVATLAEGED